MIQHVPFLIVRREATNDRASLPNGPRIPFGGPPPCRPVRQVHAHVSRRFIRNDALYGAAIRALRLSTSMSRKTRGIRNQIGL